MMATGLNRCIYTSVIGVRGPQLRRRIYMYIYAYILFYVFIASSAGLHVFAVSSPTLPRIDKSANRKTSAITRNSAPITVKSASPHRPSLPWHISNFHLHLHRPRTPHNSQPTTHISHHHHHHSLFPPLYHHHPSPRRCHRQLHATPLVSLAPSRPSRLVWIYSPSPPFRCRPSNPRANPRTTPDHCNPPDDLLPIPSSRPPASGWFRSRLPARRPASPPAPPPRGPPRMPHPPREGRLAPMAMPTTPLLRRCR